MSSSILEGERNIRIEKIEKLRSSGMSPYPSRCVRTHTIAQALHTPKDTGLSVTGRIMSKRDMGKITFCHLQDGTGKMQIVFKQNELGDTAYHLFIALIDIGDLIQVDGIRFLTQKGEESILAHHWTVLAKALLPLPDKFHGIQDEELRYRKRYLDFLFHEENKEKIIVRSLVLKYLRKFLDDKGFVEVETPMLELVASGALARSFDTRINAYDLDLHLRICIGELWQKRLLIGGFEKTYEIGRAFRNEGVDREHNPEFTMIEYYWAYADHEDNMRLYEEMIPYVVQQSIGSLDAHHNGHTIHFTPPYSVVTFREAILKETGIDINEYGTTEKLIKIMREKKFDVEETAERGKLLDNLFKQSTRPNIIQPTFVTEYPVELKPLTKKTSDPRYTAMFQFVVSGFELGNNYTELNDPLDQRVRFEQQAQMKARGEEESMNYDADFVEAMEHGMPPATGTGIGIDRFVALLTGSQSLREVITFPLMKPERSDAPPI